MTHNEGISWDRCRFQIGMKKPDQTDLDRVNAVKRRAGAGEIFYQSGLKVQNIDDSLDHAHHLIDD